MPGIGVAVIVGVACGVRLDCGMMSGRGVAVIQLLGKGVNVPVVAATAVA
jgi:hypothetical protein